MRLRHYSVSLLALLGLVLFVACPPTRGGDGDDPPPSGGGSSAMWLQLTQVSGDYEYTSTSFVIANLSNGCSVTRDFYEAYAEAYAAYYEGQQALQEEYGEDYDDIEYRRASCELLKGLYSAVGSEPGMWGNNRITTSVMLSHPEQEEEDEVIAGTYVAEAGGEDPPEDGEDRGYEPSFYGSRMEMHGNLYQAYADAYACDEITEENPYDYTDYEDIEGMYETLGITEGSLEVSASGDNWRLVLTDGVLAEEGGAITFDETFTRCEVSYEMPGYSYDYEG